jgi:hypothetical protein
VGQPRVPLGDTILIGKRLQPSNLEFFGGGYSLSYCVLSSFERSSFTFQGYLLPSLQSATSAFLLQGPSILFPPCDHSMLVITVTHAYNLGTQSSSQNYCPKTCQKTVSRSTYSGLLELTLSPLCPSWSGSMGVDFCVRGGCLDLSVNSRLSTVGASSAFDGAPLVEQSVARVCDL